MEYRKFTAGNGYVLINPLELQESTQESTIDTMIEPMVSACGRRNSNREKPTRTAAVTRARFNVQTDIQMLKAVLQHNPFESGPDAWSMVLKDLRESEGFKPTYRQVTERCKFLIQKFREDELADLNKTGTEMQWDERESLCESVSDLMHDSKAQHQSGMSRTDVAIAENERNEAASNVLNATADLSSDGDRPPSRNLRRVKRCGSDDITAELIAKRAVFDEEMKRAELKMREKQLEADLKFRERTMAMEERRLKLEETRMEFDKERHQWEMKRDVDRSAEQVVQQQLLIQSLELIRQLRN